MDIEFTIDGTRYSIPLSTYYDNIEYVELPNGEIYLIKGWLESYPPSVQLEEDVKMVKRLNTAKAKKVKA